MAELERPPQVPDWLPIEGQMVWQDVIGDIMAANRVTAADSQLVARYCYLQGMIALAARTPDATAPPAAYFMEARRLEEVLGIAGRASRVVIGQPRTANPFAKFRVEH